MWTVQRWRLPPWEVGGAAAIVLILAWLISRGWGLVLFFTRSVFMLGWGSWFAGSALMSQLCPGAFWPGTRALEAWAGRAYALLVLSRGSLIRSCSGLLQCQQAPRAGCQKLRQSRRELQSNARAQLIYYLDGWVSKIRSVHVKRMVRAVYCVSQQTYSNKVKSTRHDEQARGELKH